MSRDIVLTDFIRHIMLNVNLDRLKVIIVPELVTEDFTPFPPEGLTLLYYFGLLLPKGILTPSFIEIALAVTKHALLLEVS
jgi:hypothetical protein